MNDNEKVIRVDFMDEDRLTVRGLYASLEPLLDEMTGLAFVFTRGGEDDGEMESVGMGHSSIELLKVRGMYQTASDMVMQRMFGYDDGE